MTYSKPRYYDNYTIVFLPYRLDANHVGQPDASRDAIVWRANTPKGALRRLGNVLANVRTVGPGWFGVIRPDGLFVSYTQLRDQIVHDAEIARRMEARVVAEYDEDNDDAHRGVSL